MPLSRQTMSDVTSPPLSSVINLPRRTLSERVTALEVKIDNSNKRVEELARNLNDLSHQTAEMKSALGKISGQITALNSRLESIEEAINEAKLSGKDKAAIIVALITSIASIIASLLQAIFH